jgi:hypothetical protein
MQTITTYHAKHAEFAEHLLLGDPSDLCVERRDE